MAKASSTIVEGLFGVTQIPTRTVMGSNDTSMVIADTNKMQQEGDTGDRTPVEVVIGSKQSREAMGSNKKSKDATISHNKSVKDWGDYQTHQGNHSGQKTRRMCVAMPDDAYRFIRHEAIRNGMTYGEYIYALAQAAAKGEVTI